ncbi:MAG: class I SAM-dependent methyltransferase [Chloroflexota bacterium]|jgi:SAM-dependent methyltransferase
MTGEGEVPVIRQESPLAKPAAARHVYEWDDPWTVRFFEAFNRRHSRYRKANRILVKQASLEAGQAVLDFAAGTGRTADAVLPQIGPDGRVLCVEPARAMREAGQARLADKRVGWSDELPAEGRYERVLCGAAIWTVPELARTISLLAHYLPVGGALCFNIPGQYLGLADEPGGGDDPFLLRLPSLLSELAPAEAMDWPAPPAALSVEEIEGFLGGEGLSARRFSFRYRLTQAEYRDWYKIPVLTNRLLPGLDAQARAARIDQVYARCDQAAWRWERWLGWTAWRP